MPAIVKDDPWWFADPHRAAYTRQGLLGPTVPTFWTSNPAYAQVQNEHVWQTAWAEIIQDRATPQAAAEKGVQAGRGDLLEIPDRGGLSGDN
jgi:ABC-type glycerol-3-phosphate transport system substrate-binding protein